MSEGIINTSQHLRLSALYAAMALLFIASPAFAEPTRCHLSYDIKGWSIFYKVARGTGRIECANGQSINVTIVAHGGGFTAGTQSVKNGRGRFSGIEKIENLYGTYIEISGHAGVGNGSAVEARAMFKGNTLLSLAGKGDGISLGFAIGGFTIRPR